jgi:UDP-N-acetylmuramate dehydrogenase
LRVSDNAPIAPLTTLRLGGRAKRLVTAERESELVDIVREVDLRKDKLLVIGGGSNLVVSDAGFDGTVVRIGTRGRVVEGDEVTVQAGEPWDDLVGSLVDDGFAGVECLAGIPGLAGATPMQNVGAYGQDVSETLVRLRAFDRDRGEIVTFEKADCHFSYRNSVFRGRDRHVILEVTFRLERTRTSRPIRYAELARALSVSEGATAPLEEVKRTVCELRRKKGMVLDPSDPDTTSAGSFFTNPILDAEALERVRSRWDGPPMPVFPEPDGRFKLSAGWLIENAGFKKGLTVGRVAVSSKHALALTNRGGATTKELVALARQLRAGVFARFGVMLENEPVFVGVSL